MIKLVGIAVWTALVALGAHFGASLWEQKKIESAAKGDTAKTPTEVKKARPVNIPIVHAGEVQGYVVVQVSFVQDTALLKEKGVDPEPFLLDEIFRLVYSDSKLELKSIERYDLDKFRTLLLERVRVRMQSDVVRDVMIQEFNYVLKSDLRQ